VCVFFPCHRRTHRGPVSWHGHTVGRKALRHRSAVGEEMRGGAKKERGNYHFSLPAKGIRWVVPEEERGRQTCTEDMLCLFGEWGRSDGLGLPNSPRSL
jgi:hypothetical protein